MSPDPYIHLPQLRTKIVSSEASQFRATDHVWAAWGELARAAGLDADWRLSDEAREATRRALLDAGRNGRDLWVFGYGSLIWDPAFRFTEIRLAAIDDFKRRFTLKSMIGRGSPQFPALLLSLEPGAGPCHGLVFRIDADCVEEETLYLWRREMIQGHYEPCLLPVATPQGEVQALVFGPNSAHPDRVGELPLAETAAVIAHGVGVMGTNREYLENLVARFEDIGIEEPYFTALLGQVHAIDSP